ncbi:MAG: zinc ribbon domain-containing protein [Armatimonadota bacterium]|nr:MAG: zinc ribbon domain-containing protein [Armatimonadota bacterium]
MPLYEFRCKKCDRVFERLCRAGSNGKGLTCPACGSRSLRRLMSVFAARVSGERGSPAMSGSGAGCSTCSSGSCATCH